MVAGYSAVAVKVVRRHLEEDAAFALLVRYVLIGSCGDATTCLSLWAAEVAVIYYKIVLSGAFKPQLFGIAVPRPAK